MRAASIVSAFESGRKMTLGWIVLIIVLNGVGGFQKEFCGPWRRRRRFKPFSVAGIESRGVNTEILIESEDAYSWVEERREYLAIEADDPVPSGLRGLYRQSSTKREGSSVKYLHTFDPGVGALKELDWDQEDLHNDQVKIELIIELLDSVAYLHARGLPHLSLNADSIFVGCRMKKAILRVVGAGAGPSLVATKRPFRVPETWPYNAPETTGATSAIIRSNLRALLSMDAWSVGILIVMLITSRNQSPVDTKADWLRGFFDDRSAVAHQSRQLFDSNFISFLREDLAANGLIFRHGWLLQIVLGLLHLDPADRMSVVRARDIATDANNILAQKASSLIIKPLPQKNLKAKEIIDHTMAAAAAASQAQKDTVYTNNTEFGRFGSSLTVSRSGEPFRSLEAMVNVIEAGGCSCVLEDRSDLTIQKKERLRKIIPYGEIIGYRNRGDGDRWDVIVPGIPLDHTSPTGVKGIGVDDALEISGVLGVVLVKGGNHKIAIQLKRFKPASRAAVISHINRFVDAYVAAKPGLTKARVRFLEYSGESAPPSKPKKNTSNNKKSPTSTPRSPEKKSASTNTNKTSAPRAAHRNGLKKASTPQPTPQQSSRGTARNSKRPADSNSNSVRDPTKKKEESPRRRTPSS